MNKEVLVLISGRIIQAILAVVSLKLLTLVLPTNELGAFYIIIAISGYFGLSIINPVAQYLYRMAHQWRQTGKLKAYLILFQSFFILAAILAFFVTGLVKKSTNSIPQITLLELILIVTLYVYYSSWFNALNSLLNFFNHQIGFVITRALNQICALGFSLGFVFLLTANAYYWLLGQILSFALMTWVSSHLVEKQIWTKESLREARSLFTVDLLKTIWKFSYPLALSAICIWLLGDGFRVLIENATGIEYIATLSVGLAVATSSIAVIESIIYQVAFPYFFKQIHGEDSLQRAQTCQNVFDFTLPLFLLTCLFVSLTSPFLMRILASYQYLSFYPFVIVGAWINFFRIMNGLLGLVGISEMNNKLTLPPYFGGALTVVFGLYYFAPQCGMAIPLVLLSGTIITFFLMLRVVRSQFSLKIKWFPLIKVILLGLPLFSILWVYSKADNLLFSMAILALYGSYFLSLLFILYKRTNHFLTPSK